MDLRHEGGEDGADTKEHAYQRQNQRRHPTGSWDGFADGSAHAPGAPVRISSTVVAVTAAAARLDEVVVRPATVNDARILKPHAVDHRQYGLRLHGCHAGNPKHSKSYETHLTHVPF